MKVTLLINLILQNMINFMFKKKLRIKEVLKNFQYKNLFRYKNLKNEIKNIFFIYLYLFFLFRNKNIIRLLNILLIKIIYYSNFIK